MRLNWRLGRAPKWIGGTVLIMAGVMVNAAQAVPAEASLPSPPQAVRDMLQTLCVEGVSDKMVPPVPGIPKTELCTCVTNRLATNPALQPTLDGMSRGELQPRAAQGPLIARMMGAILICDGQAVEAMTLTGAMPPGKGLPALNPYFGEAADPVPKDVPEASAAASQAQGAYQRASIQPEKRCQPNYPKYAATTNATGTTRVALYVDAAGKVAKVRVNRSSGDTIGHKLLDLAAMTALAACPAKAALLDGQPVGDWLTVEYVWRLQ
ncbi:TonB family protein [Ideonella oryzae]|uniref:Energy transducer TonB n=1 Tax=Ideonella oryzae TaxID=2937441 RepID=A0ABT1BRZ1_9BURK|nr:TonB family protein [Ideonella oryzae]MCO5978992.1 energy transducer TonB [Ideonella oryzae]